MTSFLEGVSVEMMMQVLRLLVLAEAGTMTSFLEGVTVEMTVQVLRLLVLSIAAIYVAYQTHRHFSLNRTQHYIERFNSGDMRDIRIKVDDWVSSGQHFEGFFPDTGRPSEAHLRDLESLQLLSSFFQELGTAYRYGAVNRPYTWDVFVRLILKYGNELSGFVCESRTRLDRPTQYNDFEKLVEDMMKIDRKKTKSSPKSTWFEDHR